MILTTVRATPAVHAAACTPRRPAPLNHSAELHVAILFAPPGCHLVRVWPVSTGVGFRIRALTIYEREQAGLSFERLDEEGS